MYSPWCRSGGVARASKCRDLPCSLPDPRPSRGSGEYAPPMVYRFLRGINEIYGVTVLFVFIALFFIALAFTVIYPLVPIVLMISSIFLVVFVRLVYLGLKAAELMLARDEANLRGQLKTALAAVQRGADAVGAIDGGLDDRLEFRPQCRQFFGIRFAVESLHRKHAAVAQVAVVGDGQHFSTGFLFEFFQMSPQVFRILTVELRVRHGAIRHAGIAAEEHVSVKIVPSHGGVFETDDRTETSGLVVFVRQRGVGLPGVL